MLSKRTFPTGSARMVAFDSWRATRKPCSIGHLPEPPCRSSEIVRARPGYADFLLVCAAVAIATHGESVHAAGQGALDRESAPTQAVRLRAGDEVFSIEPAKIDRVDFIRSDHVVTAKRTGRQATFAIVASNSRAASTTRCTSGPNFDRIVSELATIRVTQSLSVVDARMTWRRHREQFVLRVHDDSAADPKEFTGIVLEAPRRVLLRDQDTVFVASIYGDTIARLSAICDSP